MAEVRKLSITLRPDLLDRMDEYADTNGMTRSGLISVAVSQYLNAAEAMPKLPAFFDKLSEIVDLTAKGDIPETELKARLDRLEKATYEFNQLSLK